jgi:hypothetical protein
MAYFDDVVLTIKAESDVITPDPDFSCDARGATLTPETTVTTRNMLCGPKVSVSDPVWTCTIDFDQNWQAEGLSQYLVDHTGEKATVTIQSSTLLKEATFTATLVPGAFGGTAGEIAEASVDLGVDDQPVFTDYTPPAVLEADAGELVDA